MMPTEEAMVTVKYVKPGPGMKVPERVSVGTGYSKDLECGGKEVEVTDLELMMLRSSNVAPYIAVKGGEKAIAESERRYRGDPTTPYGTGPVAARLHEGAFADVESSALSRPVAEIERDAQPEPTEEERQEAERQRQAGSQSPQEPQEPEEGSGQGAEGGEPQEGDERAPGKAGKK
jgi:hypothetical protein